MTQIQKLYRLRVYERNGFDVDFTYASNYLSAAPTVGGQVVRPLDGRTEAKPWNVEVLDYDGNFTARLADAGGRMSLMRRKADVSVSTNAGSTYTVLATGRVTNVRISSETPVVYALEMQDERLIERTAKIWTTCGTTRVFPLGFTSGSYGPFVNPDISIENPFIGQKAYSATVVYATSTAWSPCRLIQTDTLWNPDNVPEVVRRVINDDVRPGMEWVYPNEVGGAAGDRGSFRSLRANIGGNDYEVVALGRANFGSLGLRVFDEPLQPTDELNPIWIYDPSATTQVGDEVYLYFPEGREPDRDVPLHLEGDPFEIVRDIYGDLGIAYDTTRLSTYNETTNPTGLIGHPFYGFDMRWRITGSDTAAKWLEDSIYKPLGVLPCVDETGAIVPVPLMMPWEYEIPDPDALFTFTDANIAAQPAVTWDHDLSNLVNVISATYEVETFRGKEALNPDKYGSYDGACDGIQSEDVTTELAHDTANQLGIRYMGRQVLDYGFRGFHDGDLVGQWLDSLGAELFNRFGDGAVIVTLKGLQSTGSVSIGDWVLVESDLLPSADTLARGGTRLMQVIGREVQPDGYAFTMLDGGPNTSPLAAPTVTVQAFPSAPDWHHKLRVKITGVPAGATWQLQFAEYLPGYGDIPESRWRNVQSGSSEADVITYYVNVGGLPNNAIIYFRARSTQQHRIGSTWSAVVYSRTVAYGDPSGLTSSNETASTAELTWTNANDGVPLLLQIVSEDLSVRLPAGTTEYRVQGLSASSSYTATVQHIDRYWQEGYWFSPVAGTSGQATATITTNTTTPTLTAPARLQIVAGDGYDIGTGDVP